MKKIFFMVNFILFLNSYAKNVITLESFLKKMTHCENLSRLPSPVYTLKQLSSYDRETTQPGDSA